MRLFLLVPPSPPPLVQHFTGKSLIRTVLAPLLALIDAGQGEAHRRSVEAYAKIASPLLTTWCCFTSCNVLSLPVERLASAENPLAVHAAKSAISASY